MAAPEQQESLSPQLSSRIESYRQEIQNLVKQGGEQPQFEFKRAVALGREDLDDRLDFVKLVQALANAEMPSERCIVIGADSKEKKFHPVSNVADFDPANLSKILSKYLHPSPNFQSFRLDTDAGETFIALVLDRDQPRPIMVIKEGQTTLGKTRLVLGDIWIKKNTDILLTFSLKIFSQLFRWPIASTMYSRRVLTFLPTSLLIPTFKNKRWLASIRPRG